MKLSIKIRLALLALLPALFVAENSVAQGGIVVVVGQQRSLTVLANGQDTYAWRIYNKPTFLDVDLATSSEVEYAIGNTRDFTSAVEKAGRLLFHSNSI